MFNQSAEALIKGRQWAKPGSLLPILSADILLGTAASRRYPHYLEQLFPLTHLPDAHQQFFYHGLIQRFAEYVQMIPVDLNQALGSLLIEGLLKSDKALRGFVQQHPEASPLERYALYTAALFQDIGHLFSRMQVLITNDQGVTQQVWQPFDGPLTEQYLGTHYQLISNPSAYDRLDKASRVLLAREIMGENGFLWIASDAQILMEWLAALHEEEGEEINRLIKTIKLYRLNEADWLDYSQFLHDLSEHIQPIESVSTHLIPALLDYLREGIKNGSIRFNTADAPVHITHSGLFIDKPFLQQYAEAFKMPGSVLFQQINLFFARARQGGRDIPLDQAQWLQVLLGASGITGPLARKNSMMREGVLLGSSALIALGMSTHPVSPFVRLPNDLIAAKHALGQLTAANTALGMKPRP
jgi:hypothetical protein